MLKSKPGHGWLNHLILSAPGRDEVAILRQVPTAMIISTLGESLTFIPRTRSLMCPLPACYTFSGGIRV